MSKLVVEVRRVEYPRRKKVHWHPQADDPKDRWVDDPGGVGVETVREVRTCPGCSPASQHARASVLRRSCAGADR